MPNFIIYSLQVYNDRKIVLQEELYKVNKKIKELEGSYDPIEKIFPNYRESHYGKVDYR